MGAKKHLLDMGGKFMKHEDRLEMFGLIIDEFEDWLEEKGITADDIPCEDRDDAIEDGEDPRGLAIIYGDDYYKLETAIENILVAFGLIEKEEH